MAIGFTQPTCSAGSGGNTRKRSKAWLRCKTCRARQARLPHNRHVKRKAVILQKARTPTRQWKKGFFPGKAHHLVACGRRRVERCRFGGAYYVEQVH